MKIALATLFFIPLFIQQNSRQLPDYSQWELTAEHITSFPEVKGRDINDRHYEYTDTESGDEKLYLEVVVYFDALNDDQSLFAIYLINDMNDNTTVHLFLNKSDEWEYVGDITDWEEDQVMCLLEKEFQFEFVK